MARNPLEQAILKQIEQYLQLKGHLVGRFNSGGVVSNYTNKHGKTKERFFRFSSFVGLSDLLGAKKGTGRIFAIEVKRPDTYPGQHQKEFLEQVKAAGGLAFVARSVDDVIAQGL